MRAHGSRLDQVRVRWVAARIAAGMGERERGRRELAAVRQEMLGLGIVYDAALAGLELAVLDIEDGRTAAVRDLAAELAAVFEAQRVPREALAAVLMLRQATAREEATVALISEVAAVLERTRREPRGD